MKTIKILALAVFAVQFASGQSSLTVDDLDLYQNQNVRIGTKSFSDDVEGSPYYTEEFVLASMSMDGAESSGNAYVRYDIYSDVMEIASLKDGSDKSFAMQDSRITIDFGDKTFRYMTFSRNGNEVSGYLEILTETNGQTLAVRHSKEVKTTELTGASGYQRQKPPRFADTIEFFLIDADGKAVKFENHKKKILKGLTDDKAKQVKQYIKENKIKFDDSYRGLIAVAKYYSELS
ncbi:MAG: hypothetical protein ACSHWW_04175 [Nonlabens sp.]|uniref:hypothetical protein n=1 Tax=Nonlabens sp. TaxID=1888209 RepID=UPI003EF49B77